MSAHWAISTDPAVAVSGRCSSDSNAAGRLAVAGPASFSAVHLFHSDQLNNDHSDGVESVAARRAYRCRRMLGDSAFNQLMFPLQSSSDSKGVVAVFDSAGLGSRAILDDAHSDEVEADWLPSRLLYAEAVSSPVSAVQLTCGSLLMIALLGGPAGPGRVQLLDYQQLSLAAAEGNPSSARTAFTLSRGSCFTALCHPMLAHSPSAAADVFHHGDTSLHHTSGGPILALGCTGGAIALRVRPGSSNLVPQYLATHRSDVFALEWAQDQLLAGSRDGEWKQRESITHLVPSHCPTCRAQLCSAVIRVLCRLSHTAFRSSEAV